MDLEAPVDAWYVWLGVSTASIVIAGVALGFPTGPPPDANGAVNAIDRVAGSPYDASTTHEHEADEIRLREGKTLELRNEHGTAHASLAYDTAVLVSDDERLENVTYGTPFGDEFDEAINRSDTDATAAFLDRTNESHEAVDGEWWPAGDRLVVRTVSLDPDVIDDSASASGAGDQPDASEIAAVTDQIRVDSETGEYHVTLVVAE
ncbi:hypothetical protein ACLI4Z_08275 [Natrialbaceae archaeon A-arb3/5]